jgi:hypothetical protein
MHERVPGIVRGDLRIFPLKNPKQTIFEKKNVICNTNSFLTARLFANSAEPVAGVWGLAVGAGKATWSANAQDDPTALQVNMFSELKRKQLAEVTYLDGTGAPTTAITNVVEFITVLNATTDLISDPIREMGLIGGGTNAGSIPTNMLTAPYFDPSGVTPNTVATNNSVVLINYMTLPTFLLPEGVDMGISWTLTF